MVRLSANCDYPPYARNSPLCETLYGDSFQTLLIAGYAFLIACNVSGIVHLALRGDNDVGVFPHLFNDLFKAQSPLFLTLDPSLC